MLRTHLRAAAARLAGVVMIVTAVARADVVLAPLFRDHAVLQRDQPVPIWGRADPGEEVSVRFHGREWRAQAGPDQRWHVSIGPLAADGEGADLVVQAKNAVALHDVVVGDVWLCAGQSNMAFTVARALHADEEIATARFPLVRVVKVENTVAATPADNVATTGWRATTPETVRGFTAVGYFFAREIHQHAGVPVGIINCSYSGTRIEGWMSGLAFARDPSFQRAVTDWAARTVVPYEKRKADWEKALAAWQAGDAAASAVGEAEHRAFLQANRRPSAPMGPEQGPSVLFNGMVNPLVPYALCGVLWYQGENNAWAPVGDFRPAVDYRRQFPALIETWRTHFRRPELPFYWVQLAGYDTGHDWPTMREAQTMTLAVPHTGQAIALDIGEAKDIHPRNKREVGHRLALIARAKVYGERIEYSGPTLREARREGRSWRLRFDHAEGGLVARGRAVTALEIAGIDRVFHPASARIDGDTLLVSAADVAEPVAVRYAWRSFPAANLYNASGLPAGPFRTDAWDDRSPATAGH